MISRRTPLRALFAAALPVLAAVPGSAQQRTLAQLSPAGPRSVQMAAFELSAPGEVRIEATGAPPETFFALSRPWIAKLVKGLDVEVRGERAWAANAWILDARTRAVVWELSRSTGRRVRHDLRQHVGALRLPAGAYEVYYAATTPNLTVRNGRAEWPFDRDVVAGLGVRVLGNGRALTGRALQQARDAGNRNLVAALHGLTPAANLRQGFEVLRPTAVEIVMTGEAEPNELFDHGWIMNAETRARIWSFRYGSSRHAGGAAKNRVAREQLTLAPGKYAMRYISDDSHSPAGWNAAPPHDVQSWGIQVRALDEAGRANVRPYDYEPVPRALVAAQIAGVGDGAAKRAGFSLARAADVRVVALGEGDDPELDDYGWIVNADTRERVWQMEYARTEHAGGAAKNRLFDGVIRLPAGNYEVHYITDGSHAFDNWNSDRPYDPELWGITVLAARAADRAAFASYDPADDPNVLEQIVGVGDDERVRRSFRMERPGAVRVYALGEGGESEMFDYAWIEDAGTRRIVWQMDWGNTRPAGGAAKNRLFDGVVQLPAGEYLLHYRSDSSHSFGSWNEAAPRDPSMWGVTVRRVQR